MAIDLVDMLRHLVGELFEAEVLDPGYGPDGYETPVGIDENAAVDPFGCQSSIDARGLRWTVVVRVPVAGAWGWYTLSSSQEISRLWRVHPNAWSIDHAVALVDRALAEMRKQWQNIVWMVAYC